MAEGFTKLFNTIITSSIWNEDNETRIVWITMLALSDKDGIVNASTSGLAVMARLPVESCKKALVKLSNPDLDSRTPYKEGRRIEKIEGGWRIINYVKYRNLRRKDERREYLRLNQEQHRLKEKSNKKENITNTYTEAEADTSTPVNTRQHLSTIHPSLNDVKNECFKQGMTEQEGKRIHAHYKKKSWVDGAGQPLTDLPSTVTAWRLNPRRQTEQQSNKSPPQRKADGGRYDDALREQITGGKTND